jgi:hypothetical protein
MTKKPTESEIDNDVVCIKIGANVTAGIGEIRRRCTPLVCVDHVFMALDIGGHRTVISLPEPHADKGIGALNGIPSATVGVERRSIAVGTQSHSAPRVEVVGCKTVSRNDRSETATR